MSKLTIWKGNEYNPAIEFDDFFALDRSLDIKSACELIDAVLENPVTYMLDDLINVVNPRLETKRLEMPIWPALVFEAALHCFGSQRKVDAEFRNGILGRKCFNAARLMAPERTDLWLAVGRYFRRYHYEYRRGLLEVAWRDIQDLLMENAAELAAEMELCQGTLKGSSWTEPAREDTMSADGTFISMYEGTRGRAEAIVERRMKEEAKLAKEQGLPVPGSELSPDERAQAKSRAVLAEVKKLDPSIRLGKTGDGEWVIGTNTLIFSARNEHRNERIITGIGLEHLESDKGGEATAAVRLFEKVTKLYKSVKGLTYDGAMRGRNLEALLGLGTLPIVPTPESVEHTKGRAYPYAITVKCADGVKRTINSVDENGELEGPLVMTKEGHLHVSTYLSDGTEMLVPFPRIATVISHGDFYNRYSVPDGSGIAPELVCGIVMVRLNPKGEDLDRKYLRAEYLRPITKHDDCFKEMYCWRKDSESGNNTLKDHLTDRRSHVVGANRLMLSLLAFQLLKNSVAISSYRIRTGTEAKSPPLAA